jgi:hypothetical protein
MIFRGITGSNDWTFGKGVNSYFTKDQAIAANIKTSLMFFLNDCFFAMDTGIDWWNLLGGKNPAAKANVLLQTRQTIVQCEGVVRINSVDARVDSKRKITISYSIDSVYSRNITGSVSTP